MIDIGKFETDLFEEEKTEVPESPFSFDVNQFEVDAGVKAAPEITKPELPQEEIYQVLPEEPKPAVVPVRESRGASGSWGDEEPLAAPTTAPAASTATAMPEILPPPKSEQEPEKKESFGILPAIAGRTKQLIASGHDFISTQMVPTERSDESIIFSLSPK